MTAVRDASPSDVAEVARVQTESWLATYRGLVPERLFEVLTVERRTTSWERWFELNERGSLFVAEADGSVVGMANVGPTRDTDLDVDSVGELAAIYVVPSAWGRGHGRDLMIASLDRLRSDGYAEAMLWLLDGNERGRAFYESGGWQADGTTKVDDSFGEPLAEARYRLAL